MLKALAFLLAGVVIAAVVFAAKNDSSENSPSGGYNINCSQTVEPSVTSASLTCKLDPEQKKVNRPWWHELFAWPEGITAWALILTLFMITWQSAATASAASAANRGIEHSIASERAWVLVDSVILASGKAELPEGTDQVFIQCNARNHGRSAARVLGMRAVHAVGPISDPGKTWDAKLYESDGQDTPRWVILPDKNTALHCAVSGFFAKTGQVITGNLNPGESIFIHGVVRYWDMFSDTERTTRFCYRWYPLGEKPKMSAGFYSAGGDSYNQQT